MENVFEFRNDLINTYSSFSRSFTTIQAPDISAKVEASYKAGRYWPEPLVQINPNYQRATTVDKLVEEKLLHPGCSLLFRVGKHPASLQSIDLFKHQMEAVTKARLRRSFVVTTGTGSGKSLAFFLPIIHQVLTAKEKDASRRTRAIIIYPMNALANSQAEEIGKFLQNPGVETLGLTIARYTGQESESERQRIAAEPPDILLTNFMMLELILTRFDPAVDSRVVRNCEGLEFLVLDELHTYRGRQGADVALLVRRLRERLKAGNLLCIGTSATMSSSGSAEDRKRTVAMVATKLFGTEVSEDDVIGETLQRATNPSLGLDSVRPQLAARLQQSSGLWANVDDFRNDPLAVWAELTLGLDLRDQSKPERARPRSLSDAAKALSSDADADINLARAALEQFLLAAQAITTPDGRSLFAFKLHQFISGPGKVLCTLEPDEKRQITLEAQRFAPGRQDEAVLLFNTHFCRECGQEYHPVWEAGESLPHFSPREIDDVGVDNDERHFGFLMPVRKGQDYQGRTEDLPDSWLDGDKVKSSYKDAVPRSENVDARGHRGGGQRYWFIPGKFRFCLCCSHEHQAHGRDINRLSSLSGEGRSSATTILTLAILRQHFSEPHEPGAPDFRKMLGFTDNRQDAALQAGHFNDFLYLLLLRASLIAALRRKGGALQAGEVGVEVFRALGFESSDESIAAEYLQEPELFGVAREDADRAARFVLGYRLMRDLRKGWRFNNPNLLQLKLLAIEYRGLEEFAGKESLYSEEKEPRNLAPTGRRAWQLLRSLPREGRTELGRIIFRAMLRDLCVESEYLDPARQDSYRASIGSYLNERWGFGPDESLATTKYLILDKRPETKGNKKRDDLIGGGPQSRLIREIRYSDLGKKHDLRREHGELLVELVRAFLTVAAKGGFVSSSPRDKLLTGWTLKDSALLWKLIEGPPEPGTAVNAFFRDLYNSVADLLGTPDHFFFDFEAHEHTAQVDADRRKLLEARFRQSELDRRWWKESGQNGPLIRLPALYCSPTMELGVDISALNTVYMRNVPPTPANYAQRSGRAGRSGQAALVITYSAAMSPHDQWFFHHADQMVHGVVKAPTLDLANRGLIESHIHAIWLAAVERQIDTSIAPLLDLNVPGKPLQEDLREAITHPAVETRALRATKAVMAQVESELAGVRWYSPGYLEDVVRRSAEDFAKAFDRWRELYDATHKQMASADAIAKSPATSPIDRENAKRRYLDAVNQLKLLLKTSGGQNNDFYTFRYLASQGFLPGYNFPRLPLMAWIPATGRKATGKDDSGNMVSRPRFLALAEFGPRSLIYHEGRMFRVVRAKLNVTAADHISAEARLATLNALVCTYCGYGHLGRPEDPEPKHSVCEHCGEKFPTEARVNELYRIETVETKPVERISANDEERQRQGFDIITTYRFLPGPGGVVDRQIAGVMLGDKKVADLTYSPAASIWRINRGWRRRKNKTQLGFYINPLTGLWSKQEDEGGAGEGDGEKPPEEQTKTAPQRIVPFVEDHRNLLILTPGTMPKESMATIQAALKRGIEQTFQIESSELVVEALPDSSHRRALLFYEAAEGGAGVLNRLATDSTQLAEVARLALSIMHYAVPHGAFSADVLRDEAGAQAGEQAPQCEAGCYQCLLSYYNQPDHEIIDRRDAPAVSFLAELANGVVNPFRLETVSSPDKASADGALAAWLEEVSRLGLRKPDRLDIPINGGAAKADAAYQSARALVFLSSPAEDTVAYVHDRGFTLIEFPTEDAQWLSVFSAHPTVFGPIAKSE